MKTHETCPLCGHEMDAHLYTTADGRTFNLFFCDVCECDFCAVGFDEYIALDEPFGTRPIDVVITEVNE